MIDGLFKAFTFHRAEIDSKIDPSSFSRSNAIGAGHFVLGLLKVDVKIFDWCCVSEERQV